MKLFCYSPSKVDSQAHILVIELFGVAAQNHVLKVCKMRIIS